VSVSVMLGGGREGGVWRRGKGWSDRHSIIILFTASSLLRSTSKGGREGGEERGKEGRTELKAGVELIEGQVRVLVVAQSVGLGEGRRFGPVVVVVDVIVVVCKEKEGEREGGKV